jgi:putative nucleotidyltransferase with HDIG domain
MRVTAMLQDVNASPRKIADSIGIDPALTAKILQSANSPIYAMRRSIMSLPNAVMAMGNQAIYGIVISFGTLDVFANEIRYSTIGRSIWEHSLAVGIAAREIGTMLNFRGTEELFTCGLLHDIGRLLFLRHDVKTYSQIEGEFLESEVLKFEKEVFGFTHDQVGGLAASRWGLPDQICHNIANHHNPSQAAMFMLTARVINIADEVVIAGTSRQRGIDPPDLSMDESVIALELSVEQLEQVWENTQANLGQMMQVFR